MTRMKTLTGTKPQSNCHKQPCPCGCNDYPDEPCLLACIERPTFFYGQVLNDKDLNAIVDYTRRRLALRRLQDGWGVVSGLRAQLDPANPFRVIVTPGVAIDCCGDDIVICEPFPVDLTCVQPEPDNCPPKEESRQTNKDAQLVVDLYAHYHETPTEPRTTMTRRSSGDVQCDFSRALETGVITIECIKDPFMKDDSVDRWLDELIAIITRVERWAEDTLENLREIDRLKSWFEETTKAIEKIEERLRNEKDSSAQEKLTYERNRLLLEQADAKRQIHSQVENLIKKFKGWVYDHPPFEFNPLLGFDEKTADRIVTSNLCFMLNDYINEWLHNWCSRPVACNGVRIARVWLVYDDVAKKYQIIFIDNQPPIRQRPGANCFPVKPRSINISPIIWQPVEEARAWLADRGVRIHENYDRSPETINRLLYTLATLRDRNVLQARLFASLEVDKPFEVYTLATGLPSPRVSLIGFESTPSPRQTAQDASDIRLEQIFGGAEAKSASAEAPQPDEKPAE